MSERPSVHEQLVIVDETLELMRRTGAMSRPLATGDPHESVIQCVKTLLDKYAETGDFLTNILKLPAFPQMILLECINGVGGYHSLGLDIRVRVKNVSPEPVKIFTGKTHHAVRSPITGSETAMATATKNHAMIPAGAEIELPARQAVSVLSRYNRLAWDPMLQDRWPHEHDSIREVGYSWVSETTFERRASKKAKK